MTREYPAGFGRQSYRGALDAYFADRWMTLMRTIFPGILVTVVLLGRVWAEEPRAFDGKTVEGWRAVLRDKSGRTVWRRQAVWALGCFGQAANVAVPDLIDALQNEQFKDQAAESLARIGSGVEVLRFLGGR